MPTSGYFANDLPMTFTVFGPCSAEGGGLAGAVVNEGGITTVAVTLHGDHMLFDRFPGGAEMVSRRAQWLADSDLDGDDRITQVELEAIDAAILVAEEEGAFIGLCSVCLDLNSVRFGQRCWIEDLATDPAQRSRGIGRDLLDAAKECVQDAQRCAGGARFGEAAMPREREVLEGLGNVPPLA
jgi:GNAT superfamily N-acetyltransferase